MFDKDGKLDERSQRILAEQTIPPRYGLSPGMQALGPAMTNEEMARAIATKANECCHRSDGFEETIYKLALKYIEQAEEQALTRAGY